MIVYEQDWLFKQSALKYLKVSRVYGRLFLPGFSHDPVMCADRPDARGEVVDGDGRLCREIWSQCPVSCFVMVGVAKRWG